ncbi:hypothetical protein A2Z33_03995 [Candidatus Gottesmanbacteria bacterium RBG_16_52_11]|uniref:Glycosyltransferase RgtA/B/C/D-like domain-containing protein n=1 Tax=Candidatus Gottesmanbacteria bacterium RBG_16_52_11 TaxID=1798374 RepID=A0A1F5YW15_9BACT|nr:MAG: hypothetical protein A2Z33_03995 [Candidatus Gottesmanbacteria bacterium RBG_16_52_11]
MSFPRKTLPYVAIWFIYASLIIFGVLYHEPWRDEAHPWMKARETPLGIIVSEDIRNEGTPILWFLILKPFAPAGFPYLTMSFIHAGLAITAVYILLRFAKLPMLLKILFPFTYYMAYEYSVISRNYVLTVLLTFAIAALYDKRLTKPILYSLLISLLFQTNSFSILPAGVFMMLFVFDILRKKLLAPGTILSVAVLSVSAAFTFLTLRNGAARIINYPPDNPLLELPVIIRNAIVPSFPQHPAAPFLSPEINTIITILTALLIPGILLFLWRNTHIFILCVSTVSWWLYVNLYVHKGSIRHHGLLLIYLVVFFWLGGIDQKPLTPVRQAVRSVLLVSLAVLFTVSLGYTKYIYSADYTYASSGARDMATYLKQNNLDKYDTVAYIASHGLAVLPYLNNKQFWYPEFGAKGYYNTSDNRYHALFFSLSTYDAFRRIDRAFPPGKPVLLLLSFPLPDEESAGYSLLHTSGATYFWSNETENLWLYGRGIAL